MTELTYRQVRQEYLEIMEEHIALQTSSTKSEPAVVLDMLGLAAVNQSSLHSACASVEEWV